jgi:hypothetical protein
LGNNAIVNGLILEWLRIPTPHFHCGRITPNNAIRATGGSRMNSAEPVETFSSKYWRRPDVPTTPGMPAAGEPWPPQGSWSGHPGPPHPEMSVDGRAHGTGLGIETGRTSRQIIPVLGSIFHRKSLEAAVTPYGEPVGRSEQMPSGRQLS